jgi:hypothetical protein
MNLAPTFGTVVSSLPPKGAAHSAWDGPAQRVVAPTFRTDVHAL